ncbi:MAG: hypothetical protein U1F15_02545 [Burkholderiales bacterium]
MSKSFVAIVAIVAVALCATASAQTSTCPSRLFVSGYYSTVHVFDACTGAYLRDLDSTARIKGPQAVKLGPDGLIYVTSEGTEQILRYRNDTLEFVDVFATFTGVDPTGFAFGPDGSVYVAGYKTSDVRRLSAAGAAIDTPIPKGKAGLKGPDNGITFGPDGNLYVPGYDSSNVIRYDPRTGAASVAVATGAKDLFHTRGLLPEKGGAALLITGEGSSQVLRLDLATGAVAEVNSKVVKPTGIAYGVDGSVLILERNTVRKLDPATFEITGTLVAPGAGGVDFGTYAAVIPLPQPPKQAVVEYYHAGLDHYFISALPADIAALDSGALKGWARTGRTFNAYLSPADGTNPVCRFYLPPANGDSHFLSASPAECAEVRAKFPSFAYEAADVMYVALPDVATGLCPEGLVPVHRLWNNRADSNHRYTTDAADKATMIAKGYVAEGYGPDATIMCAAA